MSPTPKDPHDEQPLERKHAGHRPVEEVVEIEVRYAETDQMGVVHHAEYVVWFELARTKLCAQSGFHYAKIEELGHLLMVTGVELRYRQPARYGDTVEIHCWIEKLLSRGVRFAYEVRGPKGRLCHGATDHIWVDRQTGRPCRTPKELQRPFEEMAGLTPTAEGS